MRNAIFAKTIDYKDNKLKIELEVELEQSFPKTEENILSSLNEAGALSTEFALSLNDTDGNPISIEGGGFTTKGPVDKKYQTPYGEVQISRHVYQNAKGGKTFCPLDNKYRIIIGSTPKFSKMVSSKYSEFGGKRVQFDLLNNHGRYVSHN